MRIGNKEDEEEEEDDEGGDGEKEGEDEEEGVDEEEEEDGEEGKDEEEEKTNCLSDWCLQIPIAVFTSELLNCSSPFIFEKSAAFR